jgi:hypothetical protein
MSDQPSRGRLPTLNEFVAHSTKGRPIQEVTDAIVGKFVDQGGDPLCALLLRNAIVHAPPPDYATYILTHPEVRIQVDRATQQIKAFDGQGNLLLDSPLDVDDRSRLLAQVLTRHERSGGTDSYKVAKWALDMPTDIAIPTLLAVLEGYIDVGVTDAFVGVRVTATGYRAAERHRRAERVHTRVKPNDPCPCGSGRKFKKCCKGAI